VWEPEADKPAVKLSWNFFGVITCLFYWAATVYYFYVRFAFTMDLGSTAWCVILDAQAELPVTVKTLGGLFMHILPLSNMAAVPP
jgi:hypothetical protein